MKFSWISLNYFINLNNITINKLIELLAIKGFEINTVYYDIIAKDYILDIEITANRQDAISVIGLATELSSILNKKIINTNKILNYQINTNNLAKEQRLEYFSYIKINKIVNITNNLSPLWLKNYLKIHEIDSKNLIIDIQKYIKIKWHQNINFFSLENLEYFKKSQVINHILINKNKEYEEIIYNKNILIQISKNHTIINDKLQYKNKSSSIISCSYMYSNIYSPKIKNTYNNRNNMQAYYEALQLIATFGKGYISKSYSYNHLTQDKYILKINKNFIQKTLGPINPKKDQYLPVSTIFKILQQLNLKPQYNYYYKNFKITIPQYRYDDLCRKIDITEEVGRIYGYDNFVDNLNYTKRIGNVSKQYQIIKKIRQYFRDLGLHEAINSSLNKSQLYQAQKNQIQSKIKIYNPLLDDQSELRDNLIENLIKNKIYNYKQKNDNIEIFEIGKVFKNSIETKRKEEIMHMAGILANKQFIKQSWDKKDSHLNWFHAKGILEQFFEKIQLNIASCHINTLNEKELKYISLQNFDIQNTICIREPINYKLIGLMGPINKTIYQELSQYKYIHIFECNVNEIIKHLNKKNHLSYIFLDYSSYPSVARDLSLKIQKHINIINVKKFIYNLNTHFIQKVEIFNQYIDKKTNKKCIGIRIIYNGKNKTLDKNDLQLIDQDIAKIYQTYEKI